MKKLLLLMLVPVLAHAQTLVQTGTVQNSNNIKVRSLDSQWVAGNQGDGFAIYNANLEPAFVWNRTGAWVRERVTVSWSPDSQRVVILDQQGQAGEFYCAARDADGSWTEVTVGADPKMPQYTGVTKITLGNWISPTKLEITVRNLAYFPPKPTPRWVNYTTTLSFSNDSVTFAAK